MYLTDLAMLDNSDTIPTKENSIELAPLGPWVKIMFSHRENDISFHLF